MDEKLGHLPISMEPLKVLLTGYVPFGGHSTNISQDVAFALSGIHEFIGKTGVPNYTVQIESAILSVDEVGSQSTRKRIEIGHSWDCIVHLGLCEKCDVPRIERRAQDQLAMRIPDNSGRHIMQGMLDGNGHRGPWIDLTSWSLNSFPTPWELSIDAGTYICNETYFHTLKALVDSNHTESLPPPCLFIHLPHETTLSFDESKNFVLHSLNVLLDDVQRDVVDVVAACIMRDDGSVLLARRATSSQRTGWEFPGGKCEPHESWNAAIERELMEELSIIVNARRLIGTWEHEHESTVYRVHLVHCDTELEGLKIDHEIHEHIMWCLPSDASELDWTGRDGEMAAYLARSWSMPS